MTIAARPLLTIEDLRSAVILQQSLLGERSPAIWQLPHLVDVQQSGGFVLGIRDVSSASSAALHGLLIDLLADVDGYPARRTTLWAIAPDFRNQGMGTKLRDMERVAMQREGVDLVFWDVDPLSSVELHVALNKLGGVLTSYSRDVLGGLRDDRMPGLATDRVRVEWWIDSPRVIDVVEHARPPVHQQIGLHEMAVLTKTSLLAADGRSPGSPEVLGSAAHVMIEIPEDVAGLQARDYDVALQWRLGSRDVIDQLLASGYLGIGLVHEGGRSFVLFKKGTRKSELGASRGPQQRSLG